MKVVGWVGRGAGGVQRVQRALKFDPKSADVLVRLLATSVSRADLAATSAAANAFGGADGVGIVEEVGTGALSPLRPGDRVAFLGPHSGGWATHAVAPARSLWRPPADLPDAYAAVLARSPLAAAAIVGDATLSPGQLVVQNVGCGMLAHAVVALARSRGCPVVTIVPTRPGCDEVVERLKFVGTGGAESIPVTSAFARSKAFSALLASLPRAALGIDAFGAADFAHVPSLAAAPLVSVGPAPPPLPAASAWTPSPFSLAAWAATRGPHAVAAALGELAAMATARPRGLVLFAQTVPFFDFARAAEIAQAGGGPARRVVVQSRAWAEELAAATADARERVADCDIAADALARIARGRNPDGEDDAAGELEGRHGHH